MNRKKTIMVTLSLLLLMQPFLSTNVATAQIEQIQVDNPTISTAGTFVKQDIGVGGEEQILTNFNPNNGFEAVDNNDGPDDYNYYGSAFQYTDEFYTGTTHTGTYACRIYGQGNEQFYANPFAYRNFESSPEPYLVENIEMNFWYYLISNPDIATEGTIYTRLNFYTPSGARTIFYYFSSSSVPSNGSSTTGFYDLRGVSPFSTWTNFQRDITVDFTSIFGAPTPTVYLAYIYFYCQSPPDATGLVQWAIDDVSITNDAVYDWCADNGGFEDGDGGYWSGYNRGSGLVLQTNDHTEGNKALNLTAYTELSGIYADSYVLSRFGDYDSPPKGLYANQPGDFTVSFDWKYNDYDAGTGNYATFYLYGSNGTFDFEFSWYLGDDSDIMSVSNSTGPTYAYIRYAAPGFGSRGVWNTHSLDIYDYFVENNITNMPIINSGISAYAGDAAGATTQVLVDNFNIIADPLGDPSFEEDWDFTASNSIPSWEQTDGEEYISFTTNAHSGDNAANLSSYNSAGSVLIYRDTHINVRNNLFSDIWWNLDTFESISSNYAYLSFQIDNSFNIYYVMASGTSYTPSNTSSNYYYYVDNYNELDTWNIIDRNLGEDMILAFGEENWNITEVRVEIYGSGVEMNSLLIDDIHFVRDTIGPELMNQVLLNTPTYYNDVSMELLVYDQLTRAVFTEVFYRIDVGWNFVVATMLGSYFYATIPKQVWGGTVEYYVVMEDMYGSISTNDNSGLFYSYDILDDIDPSVQILHVNTSSKGIQSIEVEAFDVGSDIAFVELYDTGVLVDNISAGPFNFVYNKTFEQVDGIRTLVARAVDNAGNEMLYEMALGVDLPSGFVSFFQTWGTLMGAAIVGTAWVTVIIIKAVKKPKT